MTRFERAIVRIFDDYSRLSMVEYCSISLIDPTQSGRALFRCDSASMGWKDEEKRSSLIG